MHDKYLLPKEQADEIASFLMPMLRLHPDKRAKASDLVHHAWLDGVIVQGEIDLIRRAEEEELLRREAERRRANSSMSLGMSMGPESRARLAQAEERHHLEEQIDADALKPVDDIVLPESVEPEHHHHHHHPPPGKSSHVVTSSGAHKENQPYHAHGGHKHTGSKGTISRIDTSGASGAKHSPSGKGASSKRKE